MAAPAPVAPQPRPTDRPRARRAHVPRGQSHRLRQPFVDFGAQAGPRDPGA